MAVKIRDYITRDTRVLMSTLNTAPKLECVVQNQRLILEATCDVRRELLEVLHLLSWLGAPVKLKDAKIKKDKEKGKEEDPPKLSKKAEAKLGFKERVKVISDRTAKEKAFTKEEEVEAF